MGINVYKNNSVARRVDEYSDDLKQYKSKLINLSEDVEEYWKGEEADNIHIIIEDLVRQVERLENSARDISQDIYANVNDIKEEDRRKRQQLMFENI